MDTVKYFFERLKKTLPNDQKLGYYIHGKWEITPLSQFVEEVSKAAYSLIALGIKKGDMIGIMAESSPRWMVADLAVRLLGGITVTIYTNISAQTFKYETDLAEIKMLFVSGELSWETIKSVGAKVPLISLEYEGDFPGAMPYAEFLEKGDLVYRTQHNLYFDMQDAVKEEDPAMLIFTSGSTGVPKGVLLSQQNVCCRLGAERWRFSKDDVYLNILPLAHIYGQVTIYGILFFNSDIYFLNKVTEFQRQCKILKPTILAVVPRVLEKLRASLYAKAARQPALLRQLSTWVLQKAETSPNWLLDKLFYRRIRNALGGRVRILFSSSTQLNPEVETFFDNIGLPVLVGYGLTESAPATSFVFQNEIVKGSVGKAVPGVYVRVGRNREIMIKSAATFKGYYKDPEATRKAFDEDGWFKTGDLGSMDIDGNFFVSGRTQEIFKTSTGNFVVPAVIENLVNSHPLIETCVAISRNRSYVACLLFTDHEILHSHKIAYGMSHKSDEEFLKSAIIKKELDEHIAKVNTQLNYWEQIRAYEVIPHLLSVSGGELTPTFKIRREVIEEKFASEIEKLYSKPVKD